MIATTGLPPVAWDVLIAAIVLFGVVAAPLLAVTENRRPEVLGRLVNDWSDDIDDVIVPGLDAFHGDGDDTWMYEPDDTVSWQGQPIAGAPARLTPRRVALPAPRPSGVPALPAFRWPDPGPPEPTQPVRTVYVAPVGDRRRVHVPAPLEVAS